MRHMLVAASAASLLLASGAALAQSGQGGYLGKDPGANAPTSAPREPPARGSGQGGYLGKDPGDAAAGSGSGAAGPTTGSGQGGYLGRNPAESPSNVGQPRNQGESTYGVPGKVGGSDRR
jgi:hypothetical protein